MPLLLAFLLSLFIYLSYYELLNYILEIWKAVLESVLLWMAICMLGGEKKRKYNNHHWKHLGRKFEWIHESFKFDGCFVEINFFIAWSWIAWGWLDVMWHKNGYLDSSFLLKEFEKNYEAKRTLWRNLRMNYSLRFSDCYGSASVTSGCFT